MELICTVVKVDASMTSRPELAQIATVTTTTATTAAATTTLQTTHKTLIKTKRKYKHWYLRGNYFKRGSSSCSTAKQKRCLLNRQKTTTKQTNKQKTDHKQK